MDIKTFVKIRIKNRHYYIFHIFYKYMTIQFLKKRKPLNFVSFSVVIITMLFKTYINTCTNDRINLYIY